MQLMRIAAIALVTGLWTPPVTATFITMFEQNTEDVATNELVFRTYATFDDMADNLPSAPDRISPINIASSFDTSGLTWDGTQFIVMFEQNTEDVATNELVFRTYATFDDMADNLPSAPDRISPINIASSFDTSGLTWDGTQFIVMFEQNTEDVATNELVFRTYATFDDMADNLPSAPDRISPINIASSFDTSGLAWDGTQFIVMFEQNTEDVATNELVFRTYATFDDMADNLPSAPDRVSPINIASSFDTSGLAWVPGDGGGVGTAPEPATFALLGLGLAGLAVSRGRKP
jgi:hypothetical protein